MNKKRAWIVGAILVVVVLLVLWVSGVFGKAPGKEPVNKDQANQPGIEKTTTAKIDMQYLLTIQDDASAANTAEAVNGLHVYDPTSADKEDIPSGTKIVQGTELNIFVYPTASDVHLKIVHAGEVVVDKDFAKIKAQVDDDKVVYYQFTVKGDVSVVTSLVDNNSEVEKTEPKTDPGAAANPDSQEKHVVVVENKTDMPAAEVEFVVRGFTAEQEPFDFVSGESYKHGEMVFSQVINKSAKQLKVSIWQGEKEIVSKLVEPKPETEEATFGGLDPLELEGDIIVRLEVAE